MNTDDAARPVNAAEPYDALVVLSFGGPEGPDEVMPFLRNVTRGRGVPEERLVEVAKHYHDRGGVSPLPEQCRALVAAIRQDLAAHGVDLPVYWGNRNWHPLLAETVATMAADGVRRAAVFTTSAYSSYSGCRQYLDDLAAAAATVGPGAPRLDKLRLFHNHPGFVEPFVRSTIEALGRLPDAVRADARLVFVTHSIPTAMSTTSGPGGGAYVAQHRDTCALVAAGVAEATGQPHAWDLVYSSRSGPPQVPWLEPDVNDHLRHLHTGLFRDSSGAGADAGSGGGGAVVLVPIGFTSDHMEVVHDLDVEAAATAERLGITLTRAATPGTDPAFVAMVRELLLERAAAERGMNVRRRTVGSLPPAPDVCAADCCPRPGRPIPRP